QPSNGREPCEPHLRISPRDLRVLCAFVAFRKEHDVMESSSLTSPWSPILPVSLARVVGLLFAAFVLAGGRAEAQPRLEEGRRFDPPNAPAQPASGFGGRAYPYTGVEHEQHGRGDESYWIFRPEGGVDACARSDTPPVVF